MPVRPASSVRRTMTLSVVPSRSPAAGFGPMTGMTSIAAILLKICLLVGGAAAAEIEGEAGGEAAGGRHDPGDHLRRLFQFATAAHGNLRRHVILRSLE